MYSMGLIRLSISVFHLISNGPRLPFCLVMTNYQYLKGNPTTFSNVYFSLTLTNVSVSCNMDINYSVLTCKF